MWPLLTVLMVNWIAVRIWCGYGSLCDDGDHLPWCSEATWAIGRVTVLTVERLSSWLCDLWPVDCVTTWLCWGPWYQRCWHSPILTIVPWLTLCGGIPARQSGHVTRRISIDSYSWTFYTQITLSKLNIVVSCGMKIFVLLIETQLKKCSFQQTANFLKWPE